MIKKLHIQNFKSHKDTQLSLNNINFLCGQNGVGKSSIIQSLLLLRQTFQKNRLEKGLSLNKPLCYIYFLQIGFILETFKVWYVYFIKPLLTKYIYKEIQVTWENKKYHKK